MAGATHAMNNGQVPERTGVLHLPLEHLQPQLGGVGVESHRRRVIVRCAVGQHPLLSRLIAEEWQQAQNQAPSHQTDRNKCRRPAKLLQQHRINGSQQRCPHAAGRPHHADAQTQPFLEPRIHRCHQRDHRD